ncbi:hypothetical protein ABZ352_18675 [Streptomyces griseofuscus]|uniref:hypothetical protein n=1 Tax=Streptomyces griseofuscus TaxID=146922 RepID=UPI0033CE0AB0
MTEAESITAWRSRAILRLSEARRDGRDDDARQLTDELREVHVALGERRTGTTEEQRTYLLARSTRTPLPELAAVGIDTNRWPEPPHSSPARSEPVPASPDTEQRLTRIFQSAGPLGDRRATRPRYEARYRPQDGHRFQGALLPWAIWDTDLDIPVAYHGDKDLAEYQAESASQRFREKRGPD